MTCIALFLFVFSAISALSHSATAPASSSLVTWNGRVVFEGDAVAFDWEGVSASVTIVSFSSLLVRISDDFAGSAVGGGSRWAVTMSPSDIRVSAAAHRISTFYSSSAVGTYVMFSNPSGGCDPYCTATNATTFTLTRITGITTLHLPLLSSLIRYAAFNLWQSRDYRAALRSTIYPSSPSRQTAIFSLLHPPRRENWSSLGTGKGSQCMS